MNATFSIAEITPTSPQYGQLFGIAYRILGSVHDAQDAIQDSLERWLKLPGTQQEAIENPQAWLVRVLTRVCIDHATSARARRETYPGIWLPEPIIGKTPADGSERYDPEQRAVISESISIAMLSAMERLTGLQRVCFVLHDIFQFPFTDIATIVDRTAGAAREAASSARRQLDRPARYHVDADEHERVVKAFTQACATGQIDQLLSVLAPDVVSRADGGEAIHAARVPIIGAERVASYLFTLLGQQRRSGIDLGISVEPVNDRAGLVLRAGGTIVGVLDIETREGRVTEIALIVAPEKLHPR